MASSFIVIIVGLFLIVIVFRILSRIRKSQLSNEKKQKIKKEERFAREHNLKHTQEDKLEKNIKKQKHKKGLDGEIKEEDKTLVKIYSEGIRALDKKIETKLNRLIRLYNGQKRLDKDSLRAAQKFVDAVRKDQRKARRLIRRMKNRNKKKKIKKEDEDKLKKMKDELAELDEGLDKHINEIKDVFEELKDIKNLKENPDFKEIR